MANTKDSHANDYQNFIVLLLFGPIELIARFNAQHVQILQYTGTKNFVAANEIHFICTDNI